MNDWDQIRDDIHREYEITGAVSLSLLLEHYPEYRDAIQEVVASLPGDVVIDPPMPSGNWSDGGKAVNRLIEQESAAFLDRHASATGAMIAAEKRALPRTRGLDQWQDTRNHLYAWGTDVLHRARENVTRITVQKCLYLLEQAYQSGTLTRWIPGPYGPYDPQLAREGEKTGAEAGWLEVAGNHELERGPQIDRVREWAGSFFGDLKGPEALLEVLANFSEWELEVLATVHSAATDRMNAGLAYDVEGVKARIREIPKWRPKLDLARFGDGEIAKALERLKRFRLLPD